MLRLLTNSSFFLCLLLHQSPHACCCNLIKLKRHNKKWRKILKAKRRICAGFKSSPSSDFLPYMMSEKRHKIVLTEQEQTSAIHQIRMEWLRRHRKIKRRREKNIKNIWFEGVVGECRMSDVLNLFIDFFITLRFLTRLGKLFAARLQKTYF